MRNRQGRMLTASPFPKVLGPTAREASGGFFIVVLVPLLAARSWRRKRPRQS
jgi:hypothetical protein